MQSVSSRIWTRVAVSNSYDDNNYTTGRRYLAKTIIDADYTDDIAILANAPAQAETLQHSLERVAAGIGLHVNAHKTEYMCFNQMGDISTLNGSSLKLVN